MIIPASGFGRRLRPHTLTNPKPLLKVGQKFLIDYVMDSIEEMKCDEIIFITGYMGEELKNYMTQNYNKNMKFVEQKEMRGLADAIYLGLCETDDNDEILVILSDTIVNTDFKFNSNNTNYIGIITVNNPERFGVVRLEKDRIIEMIEKPKTFVSDKAIAGVYFFRNSGILRRAIEYLYENNFKTHNEFQITDAMQFMLTNGEPFKAFELKEWIDCGTHEMLIKANKRLLERDNKRNFEQGDIINSSLIDNVSVFNNSKIRNSVLENCIIDSYSEITDCNLKDSIIGKHCKISELSGKLITGDYSLIEKEDK